MKVFVAISLAALLVAAQATPVHDVAVENPPSADENEGETCYIPGGDGNIYQVNTAEAMTEDVPYFEPRFSVRLELFTPENPRQAHLIDASNPASLSSSNFSPDRPTRFVTHGWRAGGSLTRPFSEAYFINATHNVNLVIVDWGRGANTANYVTARRRVEIVGRYVAQCIEFMVRHGRLNLKTTTLIGHSLGAHVSGFAGKLLRSGRVAQITGLDPAAPLFDYKNPAARLASGDADYVEIIHTNGGFLGISKPIGDASFYPNGGRSQPGCRMDVTGACAHARSYQYLLESIVSNDIFHTYQCGSFEEMQRGHCTVRHEYVQMGGEPGNQGRARGVYFLRTNSRSPFINA